MPHTLTDSALFRQQCCLNGQWQDADNRAVLPVYNPADHSLLGQVPDMGVAEAARAVAAAEAALPHWRALTAKQRGRLLHRWFELITAAREDLARLLTLEQGKPLNEARGEIDYGAAYIEWYAEEGKRIYGDTIPAAAAGQHILAVKQPVGVCAAVTPWNFPNAMITRKAAAALAAGCTFVVRPASQTPFSALALAELAQRAGLPDGVFNVITGQAQAIGGVLTGHPSVRKFSFTGSTAVGRLLQAQCAATIKKTSMELGGNAPFIVFNDADLEQAVAGAVASKFRNAGQTCVCTNRFYVQSGIYEAFTARLAEAAGSLKVGNGLDADTQIGPLIDKQAVIKAQSHIDDALTKGAKLLCGGRPCDGEGTFFQPTVLRDAADNMLLAAEETFAPVAAVFRFDSEEEVLARANATEYGLAAYFYTRDLGRVMRVGAALEYGMVAVNSGILSNEAAPFGGIKQSGIGREGSKYGIEDYLELKYILLSA